jgi:hypothetical protein
VRIGYGLVAASLTLMILAVHQRSTSLLFVACAFSGFSSFGFTHMAGLKGTLLACSEQRARALAGYYLAGYAGFGLPCVAVGYLADHSGLERALISYALSAGGLWGLFRFASNVRQRHAASKGGLAAANTLPARISHRTND